jgi:hypothetical protein
MALTKVSGHVIDQPFDVGIITATNFRSGVATVGTMHVTGNLQVDGTTTTLDTVVTEVDRLEVGANNSTVGVAITQSGSGDAAIFMGGNVGIATASPRQKLDVEGNINVVGIVTATTFVGNITGGSTADFSIADKIVHTGDTNTAIRFPAVDTITAETGGTERVRITSDGHIGIGLTNPQWNIDIKDTSTNAVVRLKSSGSTNGGQLQVNSDDLILRNRDAGEVQLWTNDANKLTITAAGAVRIPDNGKFTAGDNDDLQISHDGATSIISGMYHPIEIRHQSEVHIKCVDDAQVELYYDNVKKFETTSYGAKFSDNVLFNNPDTTGRNLTWEADNDALHWEDNTKATFGGGNDLKIYHDGSNSYIDDAGTGNLILGAANFQLMNVAHNENHITATDNAQVELYHNGSQKFETTTTGISVTGSIQASQEYPTIRPILDLNFAATKTLDRRITFTRDSLGTYTDDMGIVRYASNNVPRFDHDPTTGESLGLLLEESRTNLVSNSITMTATGTGSVSTNTTETTAPDGTNTAVKVTKSALWNGYNEGASTQGTISWFAKKADNRYVQFQTSGVGLNNSNIGGVSKNSVFDFDTETFTTNQHGISFVKYSNGWYRFYRTYTTSATYSGSSILLYPQTDASNGVGDTIDETGTVYGWGIQYEVGAFLTSYIPTSGSTVTRAADLAAIRRTNFTDFYNSDEGTIYCEFTHGVRPWHFCDADTSPSQRFFGFSDNSGGIRVGRNASGWTYLSAPTTGSYSRGDDIKSAVSYGPTSFSVGAFGQVADSGTTNANTGIDRLLFYQDTSNPDSNGTIRALKYYNKRLPNAQLQGLTQQ